MYWITKQSISNSIILFLDLCIYIISWNNNLILRRLTGGRFHSLDDFSAYIFTNLANVSTCFISEILCISRQGFILVTFLNTMNLSFCVFSGCHSLLFRVLKSCNSNILCFCCSIHCLLTDICRFFTYFVLFSPLLYCLGCSVNFSSQANVIWSLLYNTCSLAYLFICSSEEIQITQDILHILFIRFVVSMILKFITWGIFFLLNLNHHGLATLLIFWRRFFKLFSIHFCLELFTVEITSLWTVSIC